jgi:DNA polymerase III delta subunit
MLTLVTGPDAFLVRSAVRRIRAQHDPDGLNTSSIEARSSGVEEIVAALATPGFFGAGRVVIVNDLMTVSSKGSATEQEDEQSERPAKGSVDWPRVFGAIQSENIAVFVDRDMASVPAAVKRAMPKETTVILGDPPRGSGLVAWMKERAEAADSRLADMDARFLAELLCPSTWSTKPNNPAYDRPPDLDLFAGEIDKLALSAYPGQIERSHIVEMTAAGQPDRLFPLIDATIAAEGNQAIKELSVAIGNGDDAGRIAAQLFQQAELLAALASANRTDPVEVGRALGLSNPNRMLAISKSLQRMRARPNALLGAALETERQFKSGVLRQPTDQVYSLIERSLALARQTREGGT